MKSGLVAFIIWILMCGVITIAFKASEITPTFVTTITPYLGPEITIVLYGLMWMFLVSAFIHIYSKSVIVVLTLMEMLSVMRNKNI